MSGLLLRFKNWWQTSDRTQKLIAVCGGGFLVVLLLGTFLFASRPKMALLYSNLSPEDTGSVAMEIDNMGIAESFDQNGNISVPSDMVAKVRANLALKGKLPKGGGTFGGDFSKISPFNDPKVLTEQLKSITESELSQSIQFFDGVDAANVQITPAVDSPFESDKKAALANVTVSEKAGSMISSDQARAMANLVASAVPGLDKSKVTIFTRTGRALWDGQEMQTESFQATNKLDLEKAEARKRRDALQETLNRMLGQGNAIAMVDLTLDVSKHDKVIQNDDPSKSPVENGTMKETMTVASGAGAGIGAGVDAQQPTITGGGGSGGSSYVSERKNPVFGHHYLEEHFTYAGGDIKSMSVTVLINQPTGKTLVDPKNPDDPIVKLANSVLPPHDPTDPAAKSIYSANVVAYPFDTKLADAAQKAADAASSSNRMQQILSILPIAALLIVAFLVIKSIGKLANRPMAPMLVSANGPALSMPPQGGQLFASALQSGSHAKALDSANRFVLPEIVKQKALEAGISEEQLQAAIEEAGDAGISVEDIPSIKAKVNVPLEQIKKMANERPETVAMLIKSWLIEEGIRR